MQFYPMASSLQEWIGGASAYRTIEEVIKKMLHLCDYRNAPSNLDIDFLVQLL